MPPSVYTDYKKPLQWVCPHFYGGHMKNRSRPNKPAKPIHIQNKETIPIGLEELIPSEAQFDMNEKTYTLRKINLEDQVWMKAKYGERLDEIFEKLPLKEVCEIVFHLLPNEQKADFAFKVVEEYDDDGKMTEVEKTGPAQVRSCISGIGQQIKLVKALLKTVGISQPILDRLAEDDIKKNEAELSPTKIPSPQTGGESTMN